MVRWRNGRRKAGMVLESQGQVEIRNAPYRFKSCPDYVGKIYPEIRTWITNT